LESEPWRLLDLEYSNPRINLAVEEAVARYSFVCVGSNTLRFWRNINTVLLGRFQCARLEVDLETCTRLGIEIVRRFTGGGTVYQDLGNLNYSLSVGKDSVDGLANQSDFNALLSRGVVEALLSLGISLRSDSNRGVWVKGMKVSGIAGFTGRSSYFGHGTLLVNSRLEMIRKVLTPTNTKYEGGPVRSIPSKVTNLNNLLGFQVSMDAVKNALLSGFEEVFGTRFAKGELRADEMSLVEQLYEEKYLQEVCSPLCPVSRCLPRRICPYAG